jgi:hypothetical protein
MTSERILEAARVLFAARGYRATSMQAIADEVGITKAALYYHFESKDEILHQLTVPRRCAGGRSRAMSTCTCVTATRSPCW